MIKEEERHHRKRDSKGQEKRRGRPDEDLSADEEAKETYYEAGRDKEGNAMFDLSSRKKVFIKTFKGQKMVDIRETYEKAGEMMFSAKGVCLTLDAWKTLKELIPSIDRELDQLK